MVSVERFLFNHEFGPPEPVMKPAPVKARDPAFVLDHFLGKGEFPPSLEEETSEASEEAARSATPEEEPPAPPPPPPEPPPPMFSREELAAAHAAGLAEGREAALEEAQTHQMALLAQSVEQMAASLNALFEAREQEQEELMEQVTGLSLSIVYKLFPAMAAHNAQAEIEHMLSQCMHRMSEEPRLTVRLQSQLLERLGQRLDALIAENGFGGRVALVGDPQMPPGDCLVEWADGGAERDQASLLSEIETLLKHASPTVPEPLPSEPATSEAEAAAAAKPRRAPAKRKAAAKKKDIPADSNTEAAAPTKDDQSS